MGKSSSIAGTTVSDRLTDFLRATHPQKTAEHVSAVSGCSRDQVVKWLAHVSFPGGMAWIRLVAAYGPAILQAVMHSPPAWLDEAAGWERQRALEASIAAQTAELARMRGARS